MSSYTLRRYSSKLVKYIVKYTMSRKSVYKELNWERCLESPFIEEHKTNE